MTQPDPRALILVATMLAATACGGSAQHAATTKTTATTRSGAGAGASIEVRSSGAAGITGVPASALPGVTVVGTGEAAAAPDRAEVRLGIGSGGVFDSGRPSVEVADADEVAAVAHALEKAGARHVSSDRFASSPYGDSAGGAVQITLEWPHGGDLERLLDKARTAVRAHTDYELASAAVVFAVSDCDALEREAWTKAFADARKRADEIAGVSHVKLGHVLAVSEVPASPSPYSSGLTGCAALRPRALGLIDLGTVENSEQKVTVAVTLQVTYALSDR